MAGLPLLAGCQVVRLLLSRACISVLAAARWRDRRYSGLGGSAHHCRLAQAPRVAGGAFLRRIDRAVLAVAPDGIGPPEQAAIDDVVGRRQIAAGNMAHHRARGVALLPRELGLRQPPPRAAELRAF